MRKGNPTLNSPPLVTNMKCGHPRPTRGRCGNISSSAFSAVLPLICLKASTARHSPKKTCQGQNGDAHWFSAQKFNLHSPKTFCSRPSDCQVFYYICSFLVWGKFWLKLQENADFLFIFQLRSIPWVKRGRAVHGWFATKLTSWKPFKEALMNLKLNSTLESYSLLKKKKKSPKRAKVSLRATGPG